jgi:N-acetylglutamate synthase-like GNAT family acetyltransferase
MYRLAIASEYRRHGVSSQLVEMVEDELRKLGATRVYALALINSTEAGPF